MVYTKTNENFLLMSRALKVQPKECEITKTEGAKDPTPQQVLDGFYAFQPTIIQGTRFVN